MKIIRSIAVLCGYALISFLLAACSRGGDSLATDGGASDVGDANSVAAVSWDSGDPEYEAMVIEIEGVRELNSGVAKITVAELRALPQHEIDAYFRRTTGRLEEHHMIGPLLRDVIAAVGGNLDDYQGLAMIGRDNYYCLFSREVLDNTPDLLLAVVVDGNPKLDEDLAPAWATVQGQFGPYWVKQIARIVLYEEIPQRIITNVWVFENLTEGIERVEFEYWGSLDNAVELGQIFSRMDYVDSRAFFTMKSSDGFRKNEAINMVKSRYYIKVDGEDAPTNVSPFIMLGMNVQRIAWFSTSTDAVIFPELFLEYIDLETIRGETGVSLEEVLYEVEMEVVRGADFELIATNGERYRVSGSELSNAILVPLPGGGAKVLWDEGFDYPDIDDLLRIRVVEVDA